MPTVDELADRLLEGLTDEEQWGLAAQLRTEQAAYLRREDEFVARTSRESCAESRLRGSLPVERGRVEEPQAELPGVLYRPSEHLFRNRREQAAERSCAEPEARDFEGRAPEPDPYGRVAHRHAWPAENRHRSGDSAFIAAL